MFKVNNSYLIYFDTFLQFSILYVLRNLIINQIPYFSDIHHECPQVLQNILIHDLEKKRLHLANVLILYSLKTPANLQSSGVFRGLKLEHWPEMGLFETQEMLLKKIDM